MYKKVLLTLLLVGSSMAVFGQRFAVKTNTIYWMAATPNLGVEVAINNRMTFSVSGNYNPWTIGSDNKIQHWFVQPEYRYWFSAKYTRTYVGVHLLGGEYEVGGFTLPFGLLPAMHNDYYKGNVIGAGVSVGYQFYISPHWNLELSAGVGLMRFRYHLTKTPCAKYTAILPVPTQIGVSFVYLFNSKK